MQKAFLDVFAGFRERADGGALFSDVTIERMSTNRARDTVRLYLNFPTLIPKRRIRSLESELKRRYFPKEGVSVNIIEKFSLTSQFAPEVLFESYKDSIY